MLPQLRGVRPPQRQGQPGGHQIPKERPARYAEERQEEFPVPAIIADFAADREEPEEGRRRSRRRRGGKGGRRASCGASGGKAGGKAGGEAAGGQSPPPYPQRQARRQRHQALPLPAGCQARVPSGEPAVHRGRRAEQQAPPAPWRPPQRRSGRRYAQDGGVSRGKVFRRSDRQRL